MRNAIYAAVFATALSGAATAKDWRNQVTIENADLSKFSMTLINDGKEAGGMTYGWVKEGDTYVIADRSEMQPNILETAKGIIDANSLLPKSIVIDFALGGGTMDYDITWEGDHRKGAIVTNRNGEEKTHVIDLKEEIAPIRLAVIGMVAAFNIDDTFETSMPWFNTLANKTETITLKTIGSETVDAPAGTFETYKVVVRGGTPENNVYVTKSLPRKIVKIDVLGRPMYFLRNRDS